MFSFQSFNCFLCHSYLLLAFFFLIVFHQAVHLELVRFNYIMMSVQSLLRLATGERNQNDFSKEKSYLYIYKKRKKMITSCS